MKYYAVKKGRKPGIYTSWQECSEQVTGFSDAKYKGFDTREGAEQYIKGIASVEKKTEIEAYVDGSFNENLGKYSYGVVLLKKGKIVHTMNGSAKNPVGIEMRNVAGELEAAKQAIKWAVKNNATSIRIYHDYEGIASWANGEWAANKQGTQKYVSFIKEYRNKIRIEFTKVKGHSGQKYNDMADLLAREGLNSTNAEDKTSQYQQFLTQKQYDQGSVVFTLHGNIVTEKSILEFVKYALKEKGYKKITNLSVRCDIEEGELDIKFDAQNVISEKIKLKIFD